MSKKDKLIERFKAKPADFTWNELERMLAGLGYELAPQGKTGGSRRRFVHTNKAFITLHKPHPGNLLKRYQIQQIYDTLNAEHLL